MVLDPSFENFLCPEKIDYLQKLKFTLPSVEELIIAKSTVLRELAATTNSNASTALSALEILCRFKQAFPDTYCMAASVATLSCSTALCESTFSTLARIDVPERMTTDRKSNLSFLALEHKRT